MSYNPSNSSYTSVPAPAGTTNTLTTNMVFAGLGATITPKATGHLFVIITGTLTNSTIGDGCRVRGKYGTGTPPSNGDAETGVGTNFGTNVNVTLTRVRGVDERHNFALTAEITSLVIGTTYWVDACLSAVTGGTGSVKNVTVSIVESTKNDSIASVSVICTDPSGTSTTGFGSQMGLGSQVKIKPKVTKKALMIATGSMANGTVGGNGIVYLTAGTGTPPANGDAGLILSLVGVSHNTPLNQSGNTRYPFVVSGIVSTLTIGVDNWIDLAINTSAGGSSNIFDVCITAIEIY